MQFMKEHIKRWLAGALFVAAVATMLACVPSVGLAATEEATSSTAIETADVEVSPQADISIANAVVEGIVDKEYTGHPQGQSIKVTVNGVVLDGTQYSYIIENNIGPGIATVVITGKNGYTGTIKKTFNIRVNLGKATVVLQGGPYYYNGSAVKPSVVVKMGSFVVNPSYYEVTYQYNDKPGTATLKVAAKANSNYCEAFTVRTFTINQPKPVSNNSSNNSSSSSNTSTALTPAGNSSTIAQAAPKAPSVTGTWKKSKGKWWFSYDSKSKTAQKKSYPANEWATIKGKRYHFDSKGYMSSKWYKSGSSWYWLGTDGAMKTGWQKVSGKWYFMERNGIMQTGKRKISNQTYYLTSSGAMKTGWNKESNKWYYYKSSGAMAKGWAKVKNKWYYLNPSDGVMKTGFYNVGSTRYFSNGSGAMLTGWQKISGTWYHFKGSGAMSKGWNKLKNKWYYLDPSSGAMKTGFYDVDGSRYFSNGSGAMLTGWQNIGGKWYNFNKSGAMQKAKWVGEYYVGSDGVMLANTTVGNYRVDANGKWHRI